MKAETIWAIPDEALEQDVVALAQKGAGKTYALKGCVERLLDKGRRVIVLDPLNSWWGLKVNADGGPGYPVVVIGGPNADIPLDPHGGERLAQVLAGLALSVVIDVSEMKRGPLIEFARAFLDELYRINRDPVWLVLEEADVFAPQNPEAKGTRAMHDTVDAIARRGRARGFRLWSVTQRPARLSKDVLTQASTLLLLRIRSPQDRAAAQDWIVGHAEKGQAAEISASLASLKVGEGYVWSPDLDLLTRTHFPAIRTLDTSATPKAGEKRAKVREMAQPDLTELRAALAPKTAEVVEEAAKTPAVPETVLEHAKAAARHDGWEQGFAEGRTQGHTEGVAAGHEEGRRVGLSQALGDLRPVIARLEELAYSEPETEIVPPIGGPRQEFKMTPLGPGPEIRPVSVLSIVRKADFQPPAPRSPGVEGLTGPQSRILASLRWAESYIRKSQLERTVLAFLAEASAKASGFQNNLGALRTAGLIEYPGSGLVSLTAEGKAKAPPPPQLSYDQLRATVRARLSGPQAAIFDVACGAFPGDTTREEIAALVGASAKASGFQNNLGALRSLGLIDYPAPGRVKAVAFLFGAAS